MVSRRYLGKQAEQIAISYLQGLGFSILSTNYFCRLGEIDIIAKETDTLCFIEVRSKRTTTYGSAIETVLLIKQHRIAKAAKHFLFSSLKNQEIACRFDVIALDYDSVAHSPKITLIRDAFRLEE